MHHKGGKYQMQNYLIPRLYHKIMQYYVQDIIILTLFICKQSLEFWVQAMSFQESC